MKHSNTRHSMWRYRHSMRRRWRSHGVTGNIAIAVLVTPQICNRVTNHGDMGTFSWPAARPHWMSHLASIVVYIEFAWNYPSFNSNYYFMKVTHVSSKSHRSVCTMAIPMVTELQILEIWVLFPDLATARAYLPVVSLLTKAVNILPKFK